MDDDLTPQQYRDLAEFRRQIRQFLHFSEATAKAHGFEAQQYQLLLTIHGLPEGVKPTIRELASRMFIQHHSAVELVNRLEHTGAISRETGHDDRREVWIHLTSFGMAMLRKLAIAHRAELESAGLELSRSLASVLRHSRKVVAQ